MNNKFILREFRPGDEAAFRRLNEEWITRYFRLEPKDILSLNDPQHSIMEKGGRIVFVFRGEEALGCCALLPMPHGIYEIAKMAVTASAQGHGVGRSVLQFTIDLARSLSAKGMYLETNHALTRQSVSTNPSDCAKCPQSASLLRHTPAPMCSWT